MVKASICRPLVARSPLAASCTCCRSFWRSRINSSIVSVPTMDRSDPSSTFLTMESTCSGLASRNRSAALRSDATSRPILTVATPWTWTFMPWLVTASLSCTLIWRAVSFSLPTRLRSGITIVPPPTTTFTPLSPGVETTLPRSHLGASRAGDDDGFVGARHLVAARDEREDEDEDDDAGDGEERCRGDET